MAKKGGAPRAASYFHISDNLYIKFDNNDKKGNLGNQWQSLISSQCVRARIPPYIDPTSANLSWNPIENYPVKFFPRIEHLVSNCVTEETAKWEKSLDLVHLHKVHFSPNSPPQILIVLWGFLPSLKSIVWGAWPSIWLHLEPLPKFNGTSK